MRLSLTSSPYVGRGRKIGVPDLIPNGEVRGGEALDLIEARGTGHPGGVGTLHAGAAVGVLAAPAYAAGSNMP